MDRSNKCAASTADTMAPSRADKSQNSSVTKNLRARLKNAAGFLDALTAMTCRGCDCDLDEGLDGFWDWGWDWVGVDLEIGS